MSQAPDLPNHTLPHLLLSGFMGAGKSTLGRLVAEREGVPFIDLDETILAAVAASGTAVATPSASALPPGEPTPSSEPTLAPGEPTPSGEPTLRTIGEVFAHLGEPTFRRLEAQALARALDAPPPTVIAVGGGALLDPENRARALAAARVVTLTASPATLFRRIDRAGEPVRPLLAAAPDRAARVRDLLAERAPAYAETHATLATDTFPDPLTTAAGPTAVELGRGEHRDQLAAVLRAWRAPSILVRLGARSYPARFTTSASVADVVADILATLRPSRWFLVTDTTVDARWGASFRDAPGLAAVVHLTPGEPEKHLAAVEHVLHTLIEAGADRDAVIVAHGGGVVSDIAGFAAAILLRGVRWISVPTTLLSMADAAIGGKTGVDLGRSKNAVGAFHQPAAVVIDVRHTTTESERAFTSGLAEIAKAGAIADPELVALLERETAAIRRRDPAVLEQALVRAVAVKANIVALDERESGPRALLNFGHTLGHALEAAGDFEGWTHGEAVSLGMVAALRIGVALGLTDPAAADRLVALLTALGLPTHLDPVEVDTALQFLSFDKKRRGAAVRLILLTTPGQALIKEIPLTDLAALYRDAARAATPTSC